MPISRIDEPGYFDILVRDMSEKLGQECFSKKLVSCNVIHQLVVDWTKSENKRSKNII